MLDKNPWNHPTKREYLNWWKFRVKVQVSSFDRNASEVRWDIYKSLPEIWMGEWLLHADESWTLEQRHLFYNFMWACLDKQKIEPNTGQSQDPVTFPLAWPNWNVTWMMNSRNVSAPNIFFSYKSLWFWLAQHLLLGTSFLKESWKLNLVSIGGSRGGREGRTPPPGRPNSFDFMQFSGKFGVFTPPLEGSRPPLGKILDPPLVSIL